MPKEMNVDLDNIAINDIQYNLTDIEALAWKLLVRGAAKPKDGFHTLTLATGNDNGLPTLRTVVLRKANEINKTLFFHTDTRSRKFADLLKRPQAAVLLYDAHRRIQLNLTMTVVLHTTDELADACWAATNAKSRRSYMSLDSPNAISQKPTSGYAECFEYEEPTAEESHIFRENFAVVECQAQHLEFLFLNFKGNRKAGFEYENGVCCLKNWLVP